MQRDTPLRAVALERAARVDIDPGLLIPETPGPYTMSEGGSLETLCASLEAVGLLCPPVLRTSGKGPVEIVLGYRRILALKALGARTVSCLQVPGEALPPVEALCMAFYDNLATRSFNSLEKGMVLRRLCAFFPERHVIDVFMPRLGLPRRPETLHVLTACDAHLEGPARGALANGTLSLDSARRLLEAEAGERDMLTDVILSFRLNLNQQARFLELLKDLAPAEGGFRGALDAVGLEDLRGDLDLNLPQKADALLQRLRHRRYPRLLQAEEAFRREVVALDLPKGVKISAPPFFESPSYRMEILFRDGRELMRHLQTLSRQERIGALRDPWKPGTP